MYILFAACSIVLFLHTQLIPGDSSTDHAQRFGEQCIKAVIINKPQEEAVSYDTWRCGLNTQFVKKYITTIRQVNKNLYFFCKGLDHAREQIIETYKKNFTIQKNFYSF